MLLVSVERSGHDSISACGTMSNHDRETTALIKYYRICRKEGNVYEKGRFKGEILKDKCATAATTDPPKKQFNFNIKLLF